MADRKPVILVDADNVLYEWEKLFLAEVVVLDPEFPFDSYACRTEMKFRDARGHESPATLAVKRRPGFYLDLEPMAGAKDGLENLLAAGAEVFICTAPSLKNPTCASDKLAAIARDFGNEFAERTIITKDKTLVFGDLLVDDNPQITGLRAPVWDHVVFDRTYNRHVEGQHRLGGWEDWESLLSFAQNRAAA